MNVLDFMIICLDFCVDFCILMLVVVYVLYYSNKIIICFSVFDFIVFL